MGLLEESRYLERRQFFAGELLHAEDLQGLEAFHREMRELHNRSLHQPGIGSGLAVSGEQGARSLFIGPGYALDIDGHEIVLVDEEETPVPPVASEDDGRPVHYDLTISYPADEDLEESETRAGLCETHGTVRLREVPVFCWVRLERNADGSFQPRDDGLRADLHAGRKVRLARVAVLECQIHEILTAQRRNARPATQPRIVAGRSDMAWTAVVIPDFSLGDMRSSISTIVLPLQLIGKVDTMAARFGTTPHYTARIDGPRFLKFEIKTDEGADFSGDVFVDGIVSIESETAPGFDARVTLVSPVLAHYLLSPEKVQEMRDNLDAFFTAEWQIEWMGTE